MRLNFEGVKAADMSLNSIAHWYFVERFFRWKKQHSRIESCNRNLLSAVLIMICFSVVVPASAASFPWRTATLSYKAKSTALVRVLEDIFVTQYRSVAISEAVKAMPSVSGDFSLSPQALFEHLGNAYGLVSYFDGTTMFVTTLAENRTVLQALTRVSVMEVERAAKEFGYLDTRFVFRKANNPPALQLSGPPAYVERISDVIAVLEAGAVERMQDARMAFRVLPLKHAWAEDVTYSVGGRDILVSGVASSLRKLVGGVGGLDGLAPEKSGLAPPAKPVGVESRPVSLLDNFLPGEASLEPVDQKKHLVERESRVSRSPGASARIVGDSRMNAVVMMAPVEMLAMLEDVVRELDVEPELIQIEATVMDVQGGVLKELGFDWSLNGRNFEVRSSTSGKDIDGSREVGKGPNISIFGGSDATNFLSRIIALQSSGKTNILSRPKLATLNGIEAILSNQNVFYPEVKGERFGQLYQVEAGLLMRVVPVVVRRSNGKPDIRLRIFIEDGSIIENKNEGGMPRTSKSSISTQAIVQDGESLLIGGYVKDTDANSEVKVPLLGDIPVLGALFRYRKNNNDRQERLFLITPTLLRETTIGADIASTPDVQNTVPPVSLIPKEETGSPSESNAGMTATPDAQTAVDKIKESP